ncbi:MAG: TIGR03936 family radical SAM-associated protein [Armatimonadota bacterium]
MQPAVRHFAIVTFRKAGLLRFLSHLDLARAIDRAVRRAGLPVRYSQGFNPSAQISFASALPVGVAGERELCQIELERALDAGEVLRALAAQLPPDLGVLDVRVVSGPRRTHLSGLTRADYEIEFEPDPHVGIDMLEQAVARVLDAGELTVQRETSSRTREIDIRPGIYALHVSPPASADAGPQLRMSLALEQERLVKPHEVVEVLRRQLAALTEAAPALDVRRVTRLGVH